MGVGAGVLFLQIVNGGDLIFIDGNYDVVQLYFRRKIIFSSYQLAFPFHHVGHFAVIERNGRSTSVTDDERSSALG
jgi:hypothetical protein